MGSVRKSGFVVVLAMQQRGSIAAAAESGDHEQEVEKEEDV